MSNITFTRAIAAAVIGFASVSAYAAGPVVDDANYPGPMSLQSNTTRAQVRAELLKDKAQGLAFNDATYPVPAHNLPSKKAQQQYSNLASAGQPTIVR